jgi:meso-butanediol dehydrogenase/(S,S)-butanediol dehydrogenase/diacetyl reductase
MTGRFVGRTVVVTGGGTGIGAATARRFASEGALVVTSRRREPIAAVAAAIGGHAVVADVTDEAGWERVLSVVAETTARLDVLVANAGVEAFGALPDTSLEAWRHVQQVNVDGVFLGVTT